MKRKGSYISDRSGLYHFQWKVGGTTVMDAAVQAIIGHPGDPAWFWFNEIPAPIYMDDTPSKLVRRWEKYRKAAALGAEEFVKLLINLPFTATA